MIKIKIEYLRFSDKLVKHKFLEMNPSAKFETFPIVQHVTYLNDFNNFLNRFKNENADFNNDLSAQNGTMDNQSHSNTNLSQCSENAAHIYINNYELPIHYEDTNPSQSTVKDEPPLKTLLKKNYETLSKVKLSMSLDNIKEENADDIIIISSGDTVNESDFLETMSLDSDRLSYHSSDFEFIDEDEAKTCGLYSQNKNINEYKPRRRNKNHIIPQGNDYLELFQGRYTPYPRADMENKSTKSRYPMYVGCNGIGFNMYGMPLNVSDELRNEAAENAKKIRQMYPAEN